MNNDRRNFIRTIGMAAVAGATMYTSSNISAKPLSRYKAIAFDAFPIFDPRPIFGLAHSIFQNKGKEFATLWRTRIFEYTWLLASAGQYQDFWQCIDNALVYTAKQLNVKLSEDNHKKLMSAFLQIKAYPDVKPVLDELRSANIKLAFLSNMTSKMLNAGIENSALDGYFDFVISTDEARTFKPEPKAYQLGIEKLGYKKEEVVFTAFASWDAIGAKWFGYPTVWVNRLNFLPEKLGHAPDRTGNDLKALRNFVLGG